EGVRILRVRGQLADLLAGGRFPQVDGPVRPAGREDLAVGRERAADSSKLLIRAVAGAGEDHASPGELPDFLACRGVPEADGAGQVLGGEGLAVGREGQAEIRRLANAEL